jgi:conjugal transfer mating pair stabilization protein TraG
MSTGLNIYTPSDGEVLIDVLNSMALFFGGPTFASAIQIMIALSVFAAVCMFIKTQALPSLMAWVVNSFCVLYIVLGITTQVNVIDMADESKALTVSNVPIGLALPASFISSMGYGVTKAVGFAFHMPQDLDYNNKGMIFGSRIWTGVSTMSLKNSPDLARDLNAYIYQCVFKSKMLSTKKLSPQELKTSDDLETLLFKGASPVYRVIVHQPLKDEKGKEKSPVSNLTCKDAASFLQPLIHKAYDKELKNIAVILTKGNVVDAQNSYLDAHRYFTGLSKAGAQTLTQNILINSLRDAQKNAFAFNGDVAQLMNYTNTSTMQKTRYAEANEFWQSEYNLPLLMSSLWVVTIGLFPFIILISFFPECQGVFKSYVYGLVYLWSWPMLFNITHFIVSSAASRKISLLFPKESIEQLKTGITLSNIDVINAIHTDFALQAGKLTALVPVLAYAMVKGVAYMMNHGAQRASAAIDSLGAGEAQTAATGNISMGNYSGMNMNYDTANAHKHDTNSTLLWGQSTVQSSSGGLEHINADGEHSFNAGNSISNSSVSVSGTQGLQQSLSTAKEKAQQEIDGQQASMQTIAQEGTSHASQFNEAKAHDERLGHGASTTDSASAQLALQRLQHQASAISERTGMGHDEAFAGLMRAGGNISGGVRTDESVLGKPFKWITGAHGEITVSAGGEQSQTSTDRHGTGQDYVVSANDAKDIRQDFSTVSQYSQTHHVDTNNSQSENLMIQTGHDLRDMQTASDGYNASYQKSERISKAQNLVTSNGASLSMNLNQEAVNYGIDKVGLGHMRYLEQHPNDANAQMELAGIKSEYLEQKAQSILNHGMSAMTVNPEHQYQKAKDHIQSQGQGLKGHYEANSGELSSKHSQGLGINQQEKEGLISQVNHTIEKTKQNNQDQSQEMRQKYKLSEAKMQKEIINGKSGATEIPLVKAGKDIVRKNQEMREIQKINKEKN